ncbi:phage tail sheath family protein [Embleya hyalina]|uniref:Tail protein n=1 Tax=Embleya hyalina TaxID=516124 RepID=A0A401Z1H0_9ACTN|nr:phage tail sheath C-terminal domain-containing protein [Embleya hyalina]GCE00677.1 tail protein [Embleya hyalina]
MADSVKYSGVHGGGDAPSPLTVTPGATAVPVFLGDFAAAFEGVVRVDGPPDLVRVVGEDASSGVTGEVLRGYFGNGGGYCYLADTAGKPLTEVLTSVEAFTDVTILVPLGLWDGGADAAGETARAVTAYAAGHRAMAILHADRDHDARRARDAAKAFELGLDENAHAALYHPWLVPSGDGAEPVPPVGAVAGVWCRVDRERGVWKAPANIAVEGIARPFLTVTDAEQDEAQPVNVLREFADRGTLVRGARTLDTNDERWRHLPVRRLADTVERDLTKALASVASEPNSPPTWERLRAAADHHLHDLWQWGALQGTKPQEAYFVQVGRNVTMTEEQVEAGELVLRVGLAAIRPAEFVILECTGTAGRA